MKISISIHALLAESDYTSICHVRLTLFLSTLSLRRATPRLSRVVPTPIFLSTLSLRRATGNHEYHLSDSWDFYPRSPCGERHVILPAVWRDQIISIHALLAESDQAPPRFPMTRRISIHALLAESDSRVYTQADTQMISIHALLAESDEDSTRSSVS